MIRSCRYLQTLILWPAHQKTFFYKALSALPAPFSGCQGHYLMFLFCLFTLIKMGISITVTFSLRGGGARAAGAHACCRCSAGFAGRLIKHTFVLQVVWTD